MKWQAVFWDFDGVVLDSVDVKTKAFGLMFRKYGPDIERAVVKYHLANGGISRLEKFRYYYNQLLKYPISECELETLGREFSRLTFEQVLVAPFINGAIETLQLLFMADVPAFVVSGTPEEEVQQIVSVRELSHFFKEVHGSPRNKSEIISDILRRKAYAPGKCLFLGDAMTDYEAAKANGTCFLGIVVNKLTSPFPADTSISEVVTIEYPE